MSSTWPETFSITSVLAWEAPATSGIVQRSSPGETCPASELLREIEAARVAVRTALGGSRAPDLAADFPERVAGKTVNTGEYLMHLATHFAYHLGQVDYHRRMVTGKDAAVDAMQPAELSTAR